MEGSNGASSATTSIDDVPLNSFHWKITFYSAGGPFCDGYILGIIAPALALLTPQLGLSDPETRARVEATIPAGRVAQTGDVAAAALFLASEEAGYVQGVVLTWTAGSLSSKGSGYNVRYSVGSGKETVGKVGT